MDKKFFSCGVFLDLKKAFDTVDLLLYKLDHYGIRGVVYSWFTSYLCGRFQSTQIECRVSEKRRVTCGVPQGSVLGPLLFLLYVNDIYNASKKFKFHLFADDTNLLYGDKNLKSLETIVTAELSKVWDWLNANKLTLSVKKTLLFFTQKDEELIIKLK